MKHLYILPLIALLASCGSKPDVSIQAIDLTRPKTETKVDLDTVSKPISDGNSAAARVDTHAANNAERIKQLESELLAAKSHTEKLAALSALLEESEEGSKIKLRELSASIRVLSEDYEKQRIRWLVAASNLKDDNFKLRDENKHVIFALSQAREALGTQREKAALAEKEREQEKNAADGFRLHLIDANKAKEKAEKWRASNQWKVNTVNWIIAGAALYFILKLLVLPRWGIRI